MAGMAVCLVLSLGWAVANRLATKTLGHYLRKKGYPMPTDEELKECSREVLENIFR